MHQRANTLDRLRALHAVAIVNENDKVATNEIGSTTTDSPRWWHISSAPTRWCCFPDIDGLYDSDPRKGNARFIAEVAGPADLDGVVAGTGSHLGTGQDGVEAVPPCSHPMQACRFCWPLRPMRRRLWSTRRSVPCSRRGPNACRRDASGSDMPPSRQAH